MTESILSPCHSLAVRPSLGPAAAAGPAPTPSSPWSAPWLSSSRPLLPKTPHSAQDYAQHRRPGTGTQRQRRGPSGETAAGAAESDRDKAACLAAFTQFTVTLLSIHRFLSVVFCTFCW